MSLGQEFEIAIKSSVEEAVATYDFDELVKNNLPDIEELVKDNLPDIEKIVESKLEDMDFKDGIVDAVENYDFSSDIKSAVESYDFTDAIEDAVKDHDFDDAIESAVKDYDFSDDVSGAVADFDFSDAISDAINYNSRTSRKFGALVKDEAETAINEYVESEDFTERLRERVEAMIWDVLTFKRLRIRLWGRATECKANVVKFARRQVDRFRKAA